MMLHIKQLALLCRRIADLFKYYQKQKMSIHRSIAHLTKPVSSTVPPSPKLERINIIEEKLNYISQSKVKSVKNESFDNVQRKVLSVEKNVSDSLREIEFKVREYRESLKEMDRKFSQNKGRYELAKRIRRDEVVELQRKVYDFLQRQSEVRRESENRLLHNFEEKFQQLSLQLAKEIQRRKKYFNELDEDLTNTLPSLNIHAKNQLEQWRVRFQQLDETTIEELDSFKKQIKGEEQKREQSYQHLMQMMTEVIGEIRNDLNEEKVCREDNKNKMKRLFEGACQKLAL